jgi:hypothetical protein
VDPTATGQFTLEDKLRARVPEHTHVFTGTAPPDSARAYFAEVMLPAGSSMVTATGEHQQLPARVCAEWTTPGRGGVPAGFWQVWAQQVSPGRHNVRIDGPPGDLRLDNISESHLMALLELTGFIEPDMMADIIGPPA